MESALVSHYKGRTALTPIQMTKDMVSVYGIPQLVEDFVPVQIGRTLAGVFVTSKVQVPEQYTDYVWEYTDYKLLGARTQKGLTNEGLCMFAERNGKSHRFMALKPHASGGAIGETGDPDFSIDCDTDQAVGLAVLKALIITRDNAGARFRRMYAYLDEILEEAEASA